MTEFDTASIPAIAPEGWARVRAFFAGQQPLSTVTAPQIDEATVIGKTPATSLMLGLALQGSAHLWWTVWHDSCSEEPVSRRAFNSGFQPVPWECPVCRSRVSDPDTLGYELEAELTETVVFV